MPHKTLDFDFQIKAVDEKGTFSGYGSVFNVVDYHRDIVAKGAFAKTLQQQKDAARLPALLWQHNASEPLGAWTEMKEDDVGLYVEGQLCLDTQRGKEALALLKMKALSGLSIGYELKAYEVDKENNIWTLTEIDLWEVSLVTFPACDPARVSVVKRTPREIEAALCDAGLSRKEARAIVSKGFSGLDGQRDVDDELTSVTNTLTQIIERSSTA